MGLKYDGAKKRQEISLMHLDMCTYETIKNNRKIDPETEERKEVHSLIHECVSKGMGAEEILNLLNKKHPNPDLMPFYEGYIKNAQNKQQKSRNDDEGR